MAKMNFISSQPAFEYCMYMMLGSYFRSTKCLAPLQEKKLRFQYQSQKVENQYQMEDICLRLIKKNLLPKLPMNIGMKDMEVQLIGHPITGRTEIRMQCPQYILRVMCDYRGKKNSTVIHEVWVKDTGLKENKEWLCAA